MRLDGLPLAIELAAAQASVLSPTAILKRLDARAPLIGAINRDLPARHQTLQSTVAWSYDLLDPAEQAVFRACGVSSGGFSAAALEAVCGDLPAGADVLGIVAQLVTKSLVRIADDLAGETRFWLLETIREYAVDQLQLADELATARRRHAVYFVKLAEGNEGRLLGPGTLGVLDHLAREYANFRVVFQWTSEVGEIAQGLRLADSLYRFWIARGPLSEPRIWLEHALTKSAEVSAPLRAAALNAAGVLAGMQQDHDRAMQLLRESLELWVALGEAPRQATVHLNMGLVAHGTGQVDQAEFHFQHAHALFVELGDASGQARAQLLGAADALRQRAGAGVTAVEKERYGQLVTRVRGRLRDDTFAAAWRDGLGLTMDQAIELARREDPPPATAQTDDGVLSTREREIAALIARGQSNRGIAESLVVSVKTVETHVQHIFRKLECTSRSQIAVWASRRGLI